MTNNLKKLNEKFYLRDADIVAKELLGCYIVCEDNSIKKVGKIVETEAYLGGHDLASHSSKGLTERNEVMFRKGGVAYIYMIYGIYYCLNVVVREAGYPAAVLIRAIEPVAGITGKTSGPGLLCKAMNIDKSFNGKSLLSKDFYILGREVNKEKFEVVAKPRIGVDYAGEWARRPLRFYIKGNEFVSKE